MEVGLGWMGVGVGAAGFVLSYLMASAAARGDRPADTDDVRRAWLAAGMTAVLTLIFWAVGMRTRPPFSPGQSLAWGFLIGGLAGAVMCVLSRRFAEIAASGSVRANCLAVNSTVFYGLAGVSLAYSLFRGDPSNAIIGFAIGAVMTAVLRSIAGDLTPGPSPTRRGEEVVNWAMFSTAICAGIVLAVAHFDSSTQRWWWPMPILMATTVAVASLVGSEIGNARRRDGRPGASAALAAFITSAIVVGLTAVYAWRLVHSWTLLEVVVVGIGMAAVAAWMISGLANRRSPAWGIDSASVCVLLVIAFAVVAFKLWAGLGIAMGLIAAWSILIPVLGLRGTEPDDALPRGLATVFLLALSILLFRVFIQRYKPDLGGGDLRVHYTFIGALIGAILPLMLASAMYRLSDCSRSRGDLCALSGAASLGLWAAATPIVLYLVWEMKAVLGLVFGLVASCAFLLLTLLFQTGTPADRRGASLADRSPAVLVVGAMLVAIQFTGPLTSLETTRLLKILVLSAAAVVALAWFLVIGICSDRGSR